MNDITRYLKDFYRYRNYFCASDLVYNTLARNNLDVFAKMNDKAYLVTPFFKEIANYALINYYVDEVEFEELRLASKKSDMFDEAEEVYTLCTEFVEFLRENNCNHPSILALKDLVGTETAYDNIMDNISDILIDDTIDKDKLLDIYSDIDNEIIDFFDDMMDTLKKNVTKVNSTCVLLSVLKNVCVYRALKKGLVYGNNYSFDDNWCRFQEIDKTSILLTDLISCIEKLFPFDTSTQEIINDTKMQYQLYKSHQYSYLKHKNREDYMLEKCL